MYIKKGTINPGDLITADNGTCFNGKEITVTKVITDADGVITKLSYSQGVGELSCTCGSNFDKIRILIKKTTIMQKLSSFIERQLDEDTSKLYKSGLINGNLELTADGKKELEAILYFANKQELVKVADKLIAETDK